jgi:hypothetical protein
MEYWNDEILNKPISSLEGGLRWVLTGVSLSDARIHDETRANTPYKSPQGDKEKISSLEGGLRWVLSRVSLCKKWIPGETLGNTPYKSPQGDKEKTRNS